MADTVKQNEERDKNGGCGKRGEPESGTGAGVGGRGGGCWFEGQFPREEECGEGKRGAGVEIEMIDEEISGCV